MKGSPASRSPAAGPELATELDELAKKHGVSAVGVGVNPGFVLDHLVVALSSGSQEVTHIEARRVNDRIRALQNEADALVGQSRTLLGDLRKLEIERQIQAERVREAEAAIAETALHLLMMLLQKAQIVLFALLT